MPIRTPAFVRLVYWKLVSTGLGNESVLDRYRLLLGPLPGDQVRWCMHTSNALTHWGRLTHICVSRLCHHWFRQWLVAWPAPSHCLNQWWNIVNWTLGNKFRWNHYQNNHSRKYALECRLQSVVNLVSSLMCSRMSKIKGCMPNINVTRLMLFSCIQQKFGYVYHMHGLLIANYTHTTI